MQDKFSRTFILRIYSSRKLEKSDLFYYLFITKNYFIYYSDSSSTVCLFFYFSFSIFLQFCFVPPSVFSYAFNLVSLTLVSHDFPLLFVRLLLFVNMPLNFFLLTRSEFSRESGFLRPTTGYSHHYTFWVRVIVYMFPFSGTLLFVVKFLSFLSLRILSLFFVPFSRIHESSFFTWLVILYLCFDHVHTMTKILYPLHLILSLHLNVCT